ncbi:3-keto-disaccharide hydrolase [Mariniblastus fucicola]|uniref:3-keto-alpha-glucoside-1,2-lyase/3-keto-2-hydroxy-glucal hydratase domain-containing protein n=1 Tax=Mariniblastus fucicola TaxID=980251 RepID=A0A5B9PB83_9BACT|nr:DUF1080 domain-containing protein [Mariniblastus fucicola]QEG20373.1 hypothetical protein MFFC18_02210 [Mariniblastus fucicola]
MLHSLKQPLCRFFSILLIAGTVCGSLAVGQELDPQQDEWVAHYSKQPNAPKPSEMLLNTDEEPDLTEGFESLFNGEDLSGWVARGGSCTFEIKDRIIVGTCVKGSKSTYLCTKKEDYKDFIFTCDLKLEIDGNTGVQFRSRSAAGKKAGLESEVVSGPQVEIEGQGKKGRNWSGGIYGQSCGGYFYPLWLKEHEAARAAESKTGWNRVTISAKGNVVKTWINGVPVTHWVGDGTYSTGFFALQVHQGKAGTILFKNLKVKELAE